VNLLLDTHIWIWTLLDRDRLSARVQSEILNRNNEVWLSPISIWELLLLLEHGRITVPGNPAPATWVEMALSARPIREAQLTRAVAMRSRSITMQTSDPADRFLAATASVYSLTLVTEDARILTGTGYDILSNR
jgi:PIN domain nuclease of toxin-antitoxin system